MSIIGETVAVQNAAERKPFSSTEGLSSQR